jgi:hypothetical protein
MQTEASSQRTTTALPKGELFGIDEFACVAMAQRISGYTRLRSLDEICESEKSRQLALKIAVVSICHQFNWDLLNKTLTEQLVTKETADILDTLAKVTAPTLQNWFSQSGESDRLRAAERAEILRTVARTLQSDFEGDPMNLLRRSKFALRGEGGFLQLMDTFDIFREDPLRKKTNVLIHDMVRERIVRFQDEENIAPAIDYHLIRLYLRTGRVFALYDSLHTSLADGSPRPRPRMVRLLREKVAEAVLLTARFARLTVPDVNYIEWQLGRTICTRDGPKCLAGERVSNLDAEIARLFTGVCPFANNCVAFRDPHWIKLKEPVFQKTFY